MSLSFHPSLSPLFLKLGKIIHAAKTLDTARLTTVATEVEDIFDQYATGSIELQAIPDALNAATAGWQSSGDALMNQLAEAFRNTIIRYVKEDEQQPTDNLDDAIAELIRQMEETNTYVEYIAPTATVADVGTPNGNGEIAVSMVNRFGDRIVHAYDEVITIECTDARTKGAETFRFRGQPSVSKFAHNWPEGSGTDVTLTAIAPTDRRNLLTNGSFETADDDDATLPDGWLKGDGTAAALVTLPAAEVQTLTVTGSPTGGSYYLSWTNYSGGKVQYTDPIPYNAGQSTVQAALRSLVGLEAVTVVTTGSTPNYTHTITFNGIATPVQLVAIDDALTGGSSPAVTPGTSTAADNAEYGARAVKLTSNGTESGAFLHQRLTNLLPETAYAFTIGTQLNDNVTITQGTLGIRLVDGVGGTVLTDEAGTANEFTVAYSAMAQSGRLFATATGFFRTPKEMPPIVYLELAADAAFNNTNTLHLDGARLVPAEELYDGGPLVAVFAGEPVIGAHALGDKNFALGDKFTLTVVNAYTAEFQQWFNRFCDMDALEQQLPAASGTSSSTNEVQTLTVGGTPTGGTFTLVYDGQATATINHNANAAAVQAALEGLSNIEVGDVSCGGGALPGTPVTITFQGNLAGRNVSLITRGTNSLTGGTTPDASVALTTPGVGYISDSVFIT